MDVMWSRRLLSALFVLCALVALSNGTMHCLVSRPGYGLVSEECPLNTVACRIRVDHNSVDFYQYSPLYDRNQFVCVLKNEYGSEQRSGCQQKRSGRIRCWCFGHSNCNTPETSKQLYTAFASGDEHHFQQVVEQIDFSDISFNQQEDMLTAGETSGDHIPVFCGRIAKSNSSLPEHLGTGYTLELTEVEKGTEVSRGSHVMKGVGALSEEQRRQGQKTASALLSAAQDGGKQLDTARLKSMRYNGARSGAGGSRDTLDAATQDNSLSVTTALSKSSREKNSSSSSAAAKNSSGAMLIGENTRESQGHLHRMHVQRVVQEPTSSPTSTRLSEGAQKSFQANEKVTATPVRSVFDAKNQVHIIHVNAKDEYEHVIGSQQFADILSKQRADLDAKELSSNSPLPHYGQQGEEKEMGGREEDKDQMEKAEDSAGLHMIANSASEHGDLRRRQRNGFDSTISARNKASELEDESLEEYFDSAFYNSLAAKNGLCVLASFAAAFSSLLLSFISF